MRSPACKAGWSRLGMAGRYLEKLVPVLAKTGVESASICDCCSLQPVQAAVLVIALHFHVRGPPVLADRACSIVDRSAFHCVRTFPAC